MQAPLPGTCVTVAGLGGEIHVPGTAIGGDPPTAAAGRRIRSARPEPYPWALSLGIEEERGRTAALRLHAFALLRDLPRFLAILAANRERQRA